MNHLVLIDANSLIHRAYHAMPKDMQNSKGEITGATFGFTKAVLQSIKDLKPTHIVAAFDVGEPTFRHQKYDQYKADRPGMAEDLASQLPKIKQILQALNIPIYEKTGWEADDLVGTLAKKATQDRKTKVTVVTGDLDALQLIKDDQVVVWTPARGDTKAQTYNEEVVLKRYGFGPNLITDYKALRGDPSDNIPGVSGIGEKTASALVIENGPIEALFQKLEKNPSEVKAVSERIKDKLLAEKKTAFLSKELATIDCNVAIDFDLASCQVHDYDRESVEKIFDELQFNSLTKELPATTRLAKTADSLFANETYTDQEDNQALKIDRQLEPVLRKMEAKGVKIDTNYLAWIKTKLDQKIQSLATKIYDFAGGEFNIDSPSQLSSVIFDQLGVPTTGLKKRKAGHWPTDAETLENLVAITPIASLVLQYRELTKLINTYIEPLPKMIDQHSRLHTHYAPDTASGRISSKEPNLQNIPIRTEIGRQIRKAFIAEKNRILLSADYSQIELRVMAHLSGDRKMIEAFRHGFDIHQATAQKMGVDRRVAKTINFSILYGRQAFGLAADLHISREEASKFIDQYFQTYPAVKQFIEQTIKAVRENGYVETLFGKRRTLPDIFSDNQFKRRAAEREAINHPTQGTAAEILKKAMIDIHQKRPDLDMILTVHDELVFEVDEKEIEQTAKIVKELMENTVTLKVPLVVDLSTGHNWGELVELKL